MKKILFIVAMLMPMVALAQQEQVAGVWMSHYVTSNSTAYAFTPSTTSGDNLVVSFPAAGLCNTYYVGIVSAPIKGNVGSSNKVLSSPIGVRLDSGTPFLLSGKLGLSGGRLVATPVFDSKSAAQQFMLDIFSGSVLETSTYLSGTQTPVVDKFGLNGAAEAIVRSRQLCISNNTI